jgi:hypothetical protein
MAVFTWPVQAIAWLPEALRPGVFIAVVVLIVWFVFVRRGVSDLWRAGCRGLAHLIDVSVGIVLRLEYTMTTARRRRGKAPPQWAFALTGMTDVIQDGAARLYESHRGAVATQTADEEAEDEGKEPGQRVPPPRKPKTPWRLCIGIVVFFTAAWITMGQLSDTTIAKYRLAQAFDPWRDVEEWADVNSGRGTQPELTRARRHHTLMNVRITCSGEERCRGWVLMKAQSGAIVAARYIEPVPGSTLVHLRLKADQLRTASKGHVVVVGV